MRGGLLLVGYALASAIALLTLSALFLRPLKTPIVHSVSVGDLIFLPLVIVYGYSIYALGKRITTSRCRDE